MTEVDELEGAPSASQRGSSDEKDQDFDFDAFCINIKESIANCRTDDEDVDIKYYLLAYEQLNNFFLLLGGAFQFVSSDLKSKIKILDKFQSDDTLQNGKIKDFKTVKSMIAFEMNSGLLKNSKYVSGSRTLLRLHRGLDFMRKFLEEIYNLKENIKLGGIARDIYEKTLAEYHSWIVRNTAKVAMQFLPSREELLNKISKNDEEKLNTMLTSFPEALGNMNDAYNRIQSLYESNSLLDLP